MAATDQEAMTPFRGVITPLCTPLEAEAVVDEASLARLVRRQLEAGVDALFALGSSGEAIYLDDVARARALDVVVATVAGEVPVLAGALAGSTARVIEQIQRLSRFGSAAFVVTAPFYANVDEAETTTHFEMIAAASPVPIVVYDIPGNVGRKLPPEVAIDLLARGVIAGLKDTSGDMGSFGRILRETSGRASGTVLIGSDRLAAEALSMGADGVVPGIGNVRPDLFVRLLAAHRAGDSHEVERLQARIDVLADVLAVGERHGLGRHASEVGALKSLLHRLGTFDSPRVSAPLTAFPPAAAAEVWSIAQSVGE